MPAIHLDGVAFSYTSATEVFADVDVSIGDGWTGVVGANGAGKSTLLSLIAGELDPTGGRVVLDPSDAIVIRCSQEVDEPGPDVMGLAESFDSVARKWIGRFQLDSATLSRWTTMSPGERKRWQLAAALAGEPDMLLLDEPTNHLDSSARRLVADALKRFDGVGLVISHDRSFLDRLTNRTLRVLNQHVEVRPGPYSAAREQWEAEEAVTAEQQEETRKKVRAVRRRLADERRDAEKRSAAFRRRVRSADPSDHDATSMAAKARHAAGESAGERKRSATRSELEKTAAAAAELRTPRVLGGEIYFDYEPAPKPLLVQYRGAVTRSDHVVAHVDTAIGRQDRIRLTGRNGAGKSALLDALDDAWSLPRQRLLHLPQELTRDEGTALLGELDILSPDRRGRVLAVVASLGVDPTSLLASRRPSPGEARKLAIALGLGRNTWCLLLDEPTNHLDVDAVDRVERALEAYPGALIVVTHDESFASTTTATRWHLEDGVLSSIDVE